MPSEVVGLAAQGPGSPAFRIRVALPGEALAAHDVSLTPMPLLDESASGRFAKAGAAEKARIALEAHRRLRARVRKLDDTTDVALVQRQADLLPSLAIEREAAKGRRLVLDVDDAIWHDGDAGGHALAFLKGSRRKVHWLAREASTVVAGNDLLAEYLIAHNDRVRVIPSLVDTARVPVREHRDDQEVVLGWIGSGTTVAFLAALRPALERAARLLAPRGLEVLVVGGEIAAIPGVKTTVVPWSEATERAALERMDIGLMPLPDTPFTRGKCAYKALQYMASGVPVVADDVGISAQVIGDRASGLIASSEADWAEAIRELADSTTLRTQLGAEGRKRVVAGFSYERWVPELARILRGGS